MEFIEQDVDISLYDKIRYQYEYIGMSILTDDCSDDNDYYVVSIDDKYCVNVCLYSVQRGTTGIVKFKKDNYYNDFNVGDIIRLTDYSKRNRTSFVNGKRIIIEGVKDCWVTNYCILERQVVE